MASRLPRKPIDSSDTEFAYTSDNLFSFSLLLSCIGSHQGIHPPSWWLRSRELFSKRPGYNLLFIAARTKTKRKNEKKQGICMWGSPTTTSHGGEGGGRKEPHPSVRFLREKAREKEKMMWPISERQNCTQFIDSILNADSVFASPASFSHLQGAPTLMG